ncbi:sigma-70 family RNA polymerase sigma factor [Rubrobacter taiwanensis]|jgi:RNA polymerase sigma-70 factor (ECF subfamily)|uniref:RNA polymerase sigma factor n=1 Tax=Rubrobacter taiwanensis TaxID=185139 RepID=A0A4R1BRS9_9ACTN|nr:sigma-70 family RNA polymerase sigma factor [Rubrobacter taiwanensis]TCJ19925.1 sigma-70 family RNA polymerase sigma factor [Rubrobacter taiwanensis]
MKRPQRFRALGGRLRRLRAARTGEEEIRAAYREHAGELYRLALRSLGDRGLAEEVVQETFVRAWRSRERFDAERGSMRTWLFAIARNLVVDAARKRAARPPGTRGGSESGEESSGPVEDPAERTLRALLVGEALESLSEDHRRVIFEVYYQGRLYSEVAEDLGVPSGTLRSRMYYALKSLRLTLEEMGWSDER